MVIPKIELEDRIEILPRKKLNISRLFNIVEVEIEGEDSKRDYIFLLKASPFRAGRRSAYLTFMSPLIHNGYPKGRGLKKEKVTKSFSASTVKYRKPKRLNATVKFLWLTALNSKHGRK